MHVNLTMGPPLFDLQQQILNHFQLGQHLARIDSILNGKGIFLGPCICDQGSRELFRYVAHSDRHSSSKRRPPQKNQDDVPKE